MLHSDGVVEVLLADCVEIGKGFDPGEIRLGRCPAGLLSFELGLAGRRIVVNARNFAQWCFYEEEFYVSKDINSPQKIDLATPAPIGDLPAFAWS